MTTVRLPDTRFVRDLSQAITKGEGGEGREGEERGERAREGGRRRRGG